MVVVRRREVNGFHLRPRCKECHNARERGHRREWKRKYQQRWRAKNAKLNKSYWHNPTAREKARLKAAARSEEINAALLIQGRLRRKGMQVSLQEAGELLKQFGRCYPTRYGLTAEGLRACERIRSAMRRRGSKRLLPVQIRMMVYEDGYYIKPSRQRPPYQSSAENLRRWQREQKAKREQGQSRKAA
jgi:hypothetical protein